MPEATAVNEICVARLPAEFDAVIVYVVAVWVLVMLPLITHVVGFKIKFEGRAGFDVQFVKGVPVRVGVIVVETPIVIT